MEDMSLLINTMNFGMLRRYLRATPSPITTVLLVRYRDILSRVGTALVTDPGNGRGFRSCQWAEWLTSGEVMVGGAFSDAGQSADLDAIPESALCDVLYVPPFYLVSLRGYKTPLVRRAEI